MSDPVIEPFTTEWYLAEAQQSHDALRDRPLTPEQRELWRAQALAVAALRMLDRPGVPADVREQGRALVGRVLDGQPDSLLEGAYNDDLDAGPVEQIPGQQQIPAPRGYRLGDLVVVTEPVDGACGAHIAEGHLGRVTEIDDDPEYSIGLTVDGFDGLAWCSSSEIRHADEVAS